MRSHFWLSLVLVLGVGAVQAQPQYGSGPGAFGPGYRPAPAAPSVQPETEAAQTLREGIEKLIAYLAQEEPPNKLQVAAFLDREIAPYFDFDYMAKWVAGPAWAAMSEEQRKDMAANIEARFLSTLATQLARYQGQKVRYFRPRGSRSGAVSVSVGILHPGSYPSKLDFRMYRAEDGWKVYDVMANGRSAASFYRVQFNRATSAGQPMTYGR
jgi:phospholipid transport system substrate-binding protein